MLKKRKSLFAVILLLIFSLALLVWGLFYYEVKSKDDASSSTPIAPEQSEDGFQAIKQNPRKCGATCIFMVLNYYFKDSDNNDGENYNIPIFKDADCDVDIVLCTLEDCENHVKGTSFKGTSWTDLKNAVADLYDSDCEQYFDFELEKDTASSEGEQEERLNYITNAYLNKNIPVIIHLERELFYFYAGHYIVLIRNEDGKVRYADPSDGKVWEVDVDDFIERRWYQSPSHDNCPYYDAAWDGTYLAFWPRID